MKSFILNGLRDIVVYLIHRPKLELEIIPAEGESIKILNEGIAINNPFYVHVADVKYNYTIKWYYSILIRNNTSVRACKLLLHSNVSNITIDPIERTKSLAPGEEIGLKAVVTIFTKTNGREINKVIKAFPYGIDEIGLILSYERDLGGRRYFTRLSYTPQEQYLWYSKKDRIFVKRRHNNDKKARLYRQ